MQENNIIAIKRQVYDAVDFNIDYTLPDYIVDVRKLVTYNVRAVINNVYRTDNALTFEGEITYTVVVICEDNSIKNLIYSEDFFVNGDADIYGRSVHDCELDAASVRLISPRKLNCRSKIIVSSKNNSETDTSALYCGVGMPEAEYTTEKKMGKCRFITINDTVVANQHGSRDIELTSTREEVSNIVYCRINTQINEHKVSDGKLFLRGESIAEILYESVGGRYVKCFDHFPFSDMIEENADSAVHLCEVLVSDIKATARANSFGETKVIEVDYTYSINCRSYIETECEVLSDIYSTEYGVETVFDSVSAMKLNTLFSASLSINDSCGIEEAGNADITEIVDHNVTVTNINVKADTLNSRIVVTGDLKFDIIYKADEYGHCSVIRPFKYEREYDGTNENIYYEHRINVQPVSCIVDKERILLNAEVYFNIIVAETVEYKYIKKTEFVHCGTDHNCPVIIYYPNKEDTLWEIAKRYKTTCKDIISANSLSSEELDGIKVLLLPKKKQRSVFNAII